MLREVLFCSSFLTKIKRIPRTFMVLTHYIPQGATSNTLRTPIPPYCYYELLGFNPENFENLCNTLNKFITEFCL